MYVQTCAHIEHVLWLITWTCSPCEKNDTKEQNRILRLRSFTGELMAELTKVADSLPQAEQKYLKAVLEKVSKGFDTRHGIVHGALSFDAESKGYKMHRHHNSGSHKEPVWVHYDNPFPATHLDVALTNAESILTESHTLLNHLRDQRAS